MIKKGLLLIALLMSSSVVFGQKKYSELTKEDYLNDFDILINIIKNQHPNPFRSINAKEFDKKVVEIRKNLEENPSYATFLLSNPIPLIHDAHSSLSTDTTIFEDFTKETTFFPMNTIVYEGKVFVNQHNPNIPVGSIITSVNDVNSKSYLDRINVTTDGQIVADDAKDFSFYVSLMNPGAEEYKITYQDSLNAVEKKEVTIKSVNYARNYYNVQKAILPVDLISYSYGIYGRKLNDDTYLLTIKTFAFSEEFAYQKLSSFFEKLNADGVKNLIIDVRGNGGGYLSNIPLFYSFISQEKVFKNSYRYATKVVDINVRENLIDGSGRQYSDMDIKNMNNFMYQRYDKSEVPGDEYYYGNNRLDESYVENYPRDRYYFEGNTMLLIDNNTVSAAAYFASLFKENKRGMIIGQETRTCSNFTTASWFINYKLPNTQTVVDLPRSEVFFNNLISTREGCRGVLPDYSVDENAFYKSLIKEEDPELTLALELLKRQLQEPELKEP
ncbi:peptidase S41 [Myroides marinus]|uniref:S41 family peptidase n=1 Tax=Myroides marinus TaxID=703342 RepID=UPI0007419689|nr:S41 family peptidase [Myroides marinus]KUF43276.1 peptidase S41 [Myroides marinus]